MAKGKARILVVDDEQTICDVLCRDLSERGYLCTTVQSGEDALNKLRTDNDDADLPLVIGSPLASD